MITLGDGNLESYGCNQIIVFIVLIVTGCLNESTPLSLFTATQIMCTYKIPAQENGSKNQPCYFSSELTE